MASIPMLRLSLRPPTTVTTTTDRRHHYRNHQHLSSPFLHHSLNPSPLTLPRFPLKPKSKTLTLTPRASSSSSSSSSRVPSTSRLISAATYLLPLLNSFQYGRFLLTQYPSLASFLDPIIIPLFSAYRSIPFGSFLLFFGIYLGIVRNQAVFGEYVRFNAMQALVLDLLLSVPVILQRAVNVGSSGGGGVVFRVLVWVYSGLFVGMVGCVGYCWGKCMIGRTPYLPFVGDAASQQVQG